jgi:hypothetical protein
MRAWLLILIIFAPLLAAEGLSEAEKDRWLRRALLNPDVRGALGVGVGETEGLTALHSADAWLLERDGVRVLALFDGRACVRAQRLEIKGAPVLQELRVGKKRLLAVDDVRVGRTERRLYAAGGDWPRLHVYIESRELRLGTPRTREVTTTRLHTGQDGSLLLTTTVEIRLDEQSLEDTRATSTLRIDVGGGAPERVSGHEPGIADWLRAARHLEREGFPKAALTPARRALATARKQQLPDDDARVLDSLFLIQRLETRQPVVQR